MLRDADVLKLMSVHARRCADMANPDMARRLVELADQCDDEASLPLLSEPRPRKRRRRSRTNLHLVEVKP